MGATVAIIGLTAVNLNEQKKREKKVEQAQNEARKVEAATRANEARKSRRNQIREARIRQGEVENIAAVTGGTGSSAAIAAGDSLQARLGTNVGDMQNVLATGSAKSVSEQNILDANRKSGAELVTGAGIQIAGMAT